MSAISNKTLKDITMGRIPIGIQAVHTIVRELLVARRVVEATKDKLSWQPDGEYTSPGKGYKKIETALDAYDRVVDNE